MESSSLELDNQESNAVVSNTKARRKRNKDACNVIEWKTGLWNEEEVLFFILFLKGFWSKFNYDSVVDIIECTVEVEN